MGTRGRLNAAPTAKDWDRLTEAVRSIGPDVTPSTVALSGELMKPLHSPWPFSDSVEILRNVAYGPCPRNCLDAYIPHDENAQAVIIFVHGGAFIGGDKNKAGSPYHENVGLWAAKNGRIGVLMNYRLAPAAQWPAGAQDVEKAVEWCREHFKSEEGIPLPVHLVGTSSGGVHVATYVVGGPGHGPTETAPASVSFLSSVYDLQAFGIDRLRAYFGNVEDRLQEWDLATKLAGSSVPMLFSVGELDTHEAHEQLLGALQIIAAQKGMMPRIVRARGANHFTLVHAIGTEYDDLGPELNRFFLDVEDRIRGS